MKTFSLTAILFGCLLLTTSCSFGDDLEKDALSRKENKASQVQNDSSNNDKSSADDYEDTDTELYTQVESDGDIVFPKTKSVFIESAKNEDEKQILKVHRSYASDP